jgi:branched-chain amino acid transport system ATP-binding protein
MNHPKLLLEDIHTYYDESHVLQGVSLTVAEGEAVALLGRNGVGKTTTINSIIGFTPPRRGRILVDEKDVTRAPSYRTARMGVGLVPQGRGIFPTLTVQENLTLAARGAEENGWTFGRVTEQFPLLGQRLGNRGSQLSGGEQQMLAIARALMTNPTLLLLDEPSEGLAPILVQEIGRTMGRLKEAGLSILLVEQNIPLALALADRIYVMNKGRIVFEGQPAELQEDEQTMNRYLGI